MRSSPFLVLSFLVVASLSRPATLQSQGSGSCAANDAAFYDANVPAQMLPGQPYRVSVTMRNTGISEWSAAGQYKLASAGEDFLEWGIRRVRLDPDEIVYPNELKTFIFTVQAPHQAADYSFQWVMLQEGVCVFGEPSAARPITVAPYATPSTKLVFANLYAHMPFEWYARPEITENCSNHPLIATPDMTLEGALDTSSEEYALFVDYLYYHLDQARQAGIHATDIMFWQHIYSENSAIKTARLSVTLDALFEARDRLIADYGSAPLFFLHIDGIENWDSDTNREYEIWTEGSEDMDPIWDNIESAYNLIIDKRGLLDPAEMLHVANADTIPLMIVQPLKPCLVPNPSTGYCYVADDSFTTELQGRFNSSFGKGLELILDLPWYQSNHANNHLRVQNAYSYYDGGAAKRASGVTHSEDVTTPNSPVYLTSLGPGFEGPSCNLVKERDLGQWKQNLVRAARSDSWIFFNTLNYYWEETEILCTVEDGCEYYDPVQAAFRP